MWGLSDILRWYCHLALVFDVCNSNPHYLPINYTHTHAFKVRIWDRASKGDVRQGKQS